MYHIFSLLALKMISPLTGVITISKYVFTFVTSALKLQKANMEERYSSNETKSNWFSYTKTYHSMNVVIGGLCVNTLNST